jgi:hypothetical protein
MKMNDKEVLIKGLMDEFTEWEELLAQLDEDQICTPLAPSLLSVKDEVAHLFTWQQYSIARAKAVLSAKDPEIPEWPEDLDPDADDVDQLNAWIFETHRKETWLLVYQNWKAGFQHFQEISMAIPEYEMMKFELFPWMKGFSFSEVITGACEHHQEHRELLQDRLQKHGYIRGA